MKKFLTLVVLLVLGSIAQAQSPTFFGDYKLDYVGDRLTISENKAKNSFAIPVFKTGKRDESFLIVDMVNNKPQVNVELDIQNINPDPTIPNRINDISYGKSLLVSAEYWYVSQHALAYVLTSYNLDNSVNWNFISYRSAVQRIVQTESRIYVVLAGDKNSHVGTGQFGNQGASVIDFDQSHNDQQYFLVVLDHDGNYISHRSLADPGYTVFPTDLERMNGELVLTLLKKEKTQSINPQETFEFVRYDSNLNPLHTLSFDKSHLYKGYQPFLTHHDTTFYLTLRLEGENFSRMYLYDTAWNKTQDHAFRSGFRAGKVYVFGNTLVINGGLRDGQMHMHTSLLGGITSFNDRFGNKLGVRTYFPQSLKTSVAIGSYDNTSPSDQVVEGSTIPGNTSGFYVNTFTKNTYEVKAKKAGIALDVIHNAYVDTTTGEIVKNAEIDHDVIVFPKGTDVSTLNPADYVASDHSNVKIFDFDTQRPGFDAITGLKSITQDSTVVWRPMDYYFDCEGLDPFTPVSIKDNRLQSPITGTSYQWYKNGVAITGATNRTYDTDASGSYTVTVKREDCEYSSNAYNHTFVSVYNPDAKIVRVYPNPTQGNLHVELENFDIQSISVTSMTGQTVLRTTNTTLDLTHLPRGMYVVAVKTAQGIYTAKVNKI